MRNLAGDTAGYFPAFCCLGIVEEHGAVFVAATAENYADAAAVVDGLLAWLLWQGWLGSEILVD